MKENRRAHAHRVKSAQQPVAPVAAPWPPSWLAESPGPSTTASASPLVGLRGWRLPDGVVICACCHTRPDGAIAVELTERHGVLSWVEPAPAEQPPAPDPPPSPDPTEPVASLAAEVAVPDDGVPRWLACATNDDKEQP